MSDIEKEIRTLLTRVKTHMTVIEGQEVDEEIKKQAKRYYFENVGNPDILTLTNIEIMNAKKKQEEIEELEQKQEIPKVTESIIKNVQNVSKSEGNTAKSTQNIAKTVGNLTKLDFSVWVTEEQAQKLKQFLVENEIKFERLVLENGNSKQ